VYEPTWESVSSHPLPGWYDDAKFGIFLHWGLYSVPGWAPQVADIQSLLLHEGPSHMLRNNPYAEWYRNTMQIEGSPTQLHHRETYGDAPYDDFIPAFDAGAGSADLDALAELCRVGGARYVVLTTKHHEGFTLWPSALNHPAKGRYHAQRDLVGDLTEAVRSRGMRMGLYYSGGYDWPYNDAVMTHAADALLATPPSPAYREYATAHVRELIDLYRPSVLWNDISWPAGGNLAELFAHYYNEVDDGVVNDRWTESTIQRSPVVERLLEGAGAVVEALWRFIPDSRKSLTFPAAHHYDFRTPEYASFDSIKQKKWEATRGVGHSFGANRNERPEDIVTVTELVRSFVDIVAKNGNLLLGIGPAADGSIPPEQQVPVRGLGAWLADNGEAIFESRPWEIADGTTSDGTPVRFTRGREAIYAVLVGSPGDRRLQLRDVEVGGELDEVSVLGVDGVEWTVADGRLTVTLPERLPISPAHTIRLRPGSAVRPAAA
jgi:alpha-L-fucosidase